jgi:hypothetical protein
MKFLTFALVCVLALAPFGCQRDEGVQAGREDGTPETYQPREAPVTPAPNTDPFAVPGTADNTGITGSTAANEVHGEVVRVDTNAKTVVVRVTNGMEQTVKYDDATAVTNANMDAKSGAAKSGQSASQAQMEKLKAIKPGQTVVIRYSGDANNMMATSINVTNTKDHTGVKKQY